MRLFCLLLFCVSFSGCSFVAPMNVHTECKNTINGVDPKNTLIRINSDVLVMSDKDSRQTVLKKGIYYPSMHWEKCKYVSYAGEQDLNIKATNKLFNFFEKGSDPGGLQIFTEDPKKAHYIWYYRRGTGFLGFVPKNGDEIDFDLIYLTPNTDN